MFWPYTKMKRLLCVSCIFQTLFMWFGWCLAHGALSSLMCTARSLLPFFVHTDIQFCVVYCGCVFALVIPPISSAELAGCNHVTFFNHLMFRWC